MSEEKALAIVPRTIDEAMSLAETLSKSLVIASSLQKRPADILAIILTGREMGLAPMASIKSINLIKGKPVLAADLMIALIKGSGLAKYFRRVEESDESVTYETLRVGEHEVVQRCTWTIARAKAAKIAHGDNWQNYPRLMLAARAKSELARDVYPDVLAGCYTPEEAAEFTREPAGPAKVATPEPVQDAEIIELAQSIVVADAAYVVEADEELAHAVEAIEATTDIAELEKVLPSLRQLKESNKAAARKAYKNQIVKLSTVKAAA